MIALIPWTYVYKYNTDFFFSYRFQQLFILITTVASAYYTGVLSSTATAVGRYGEGRRGNEVLNPSRDKDAWHVP